MPWIVEIEVEPAYRDALIAELFLRLILITHRYFPL